MIRCAACRFESPDGSNWCQYCKNPFRKDKPADAGPAATARPEPAGPPTDAARKILESLPPEVRARLPRDLHSLPADTEKIPTISQTERWIAWGFLLFWLVAAMVLAGVILARQRVAADLESRGRETPVPGPGEGPLPPAPISVSGEGAGEAASGETTTTTTPPPPSAPEPSPSSEPPPTSSGASEPPPVPANMPGPPKPPGSY